MWQTNNGHHCSPDGQVFDEQRFQTLVCRLKTYSVPLAIDPLESGCTISKDCNGYSTLLYRLLWSNDNQITVEDMIVDHAIATNPQGITTVTNEFGGQEERILGKWAREKEMVMIPRNIPEAFSITESGSSAVRRE